MKEIFAKIKSWLGKYIKKDISYTRESIRPARDWKIILISFSVLLVISVFFFIYLYIEINNDSLFTTTVTSVDMNEKINTDLLQKTVDQINTNVTIFSNAQTGTSTVADPSI